MINRRAFAQTLAATAFAASATPSVCATEATQATSAPPYKVSIMLWSVFKDLPFERRLEKVAEAGYTNVELVAEYDKWSEDDFVRAIAKSKELGISFDCTAGLKHGISNPADRDTLLAELARTLPIMQRLNCPAIILLSGNILPGMSPEAQQQSCVDCLTAAVKLVEGKKINGEPVRLLLENIDPEENPRYFLTSAARGFEIIKTVNHPQVQFLYDFFHGQISEGNLIEKVEKNIQHLGLVHIADVPGRHQPGTGEINYQNIFRKLTELKYDHVVAMEFYPTGDPVTQLRAAREMALRAGA